MKKVKKLIGLLFLFYGLSPIAAQVITGTVTDKSNQPLPGVNIIVEGTNSNRGTTTDFDGNYSITASSSNILQFSYIGFVSQSVVLGNQTIINVVLQEDSQKLDEVVVIGYGKKKKSSLTTAISTVQGEELAKLANSDLRQSLQGMAPGLTITDFGGAPGSENFNIRIRGVTSLNNNNPLIMVDGVERSLNTINPETISSVSVLKDATSSAIYGSRGANGVILIETKRGSEDTKLKVSYNMYYGRQNQAIVADLATTEDFFRVYNLAKVNKGDSAVYTEENIQAYLAGMENYPDLYPSAYPSPEDVTEWAPITNHSFTLNGGSKIVSTFLNAQYVYNNSFLKTKNDEKRFQITLNNDFRINDKIKLFTNIFLQQRDVERTKTNIARLFNYPRNILSGLAPDGSLISGISGGSDFMELDPDIVGSFKQRRNEYSLNLGAEIEIIDGLKWISNVSIRSNKNKDEDVTPTYELYHWWTEEDKMVSNRVNNELKYGFYNSTLISLKSILNYHKEIKNHKMDLLAGYSQDEYSSDNNNMSGINLYNNDLKGLQASEVETRKISNYFNEWGLRSYFFRASYDYSDKYMVELSMRTDGSSRFPEGNKYSNFPGISTAWRIDKENFWKSISETMNFLKVRASYGVTGNQNIGNYEYIDQLNLSQDYVFNGNIVNTVGRSSLAAKDLTWEETTQLNIGIDMGFWRNKLTFSFDVYDKQTEGILLTLPIAAVVGLEAGRSNAGTVSNKGYEIEGTWKDNIKDFKYQIGFNFAKNEDILTDYAGLPKSTSNFKSSSFREVGYPLYSLQGLIQDGYYQNQQEIDDGPVVKVRNRVLIPGLPKYRDISGPDGVPDNVIDNYDYTYLGTATPTYTFGFNLNMEYKNFSLSMMWQGAGGNKRWLGLHASSPQGWANNSMLQAAADDYWTSTNTDAEWPTPQANSLINIYPSSRTLKDASYTRLKDLTLGYSVPRSIIDKLKLDNLRFFVTATNPIIISEFANKYGHDPEGGQIGDTRGNYYYQTKSFKVGLNVNF